MDAKMSKRFGNVIDPDDIRTYGADTLRVYGIFMGPFNQTVRGIQKYYWRAFGGTCLLEQKRH